MAKKVTLEKVTANFSRWQSRLRRAANMVAKLEGQRKRLEKAASKPKAAPPISEAVAAPPPVAPPVAVPAGEIDTTIPAFLQRKKLEPAAAQIVAEQAEQKRLKAAGRAARKKAEKAGETKRMPLTGRAALAAIRGDAGAEKR